MHDAVGRDAFVVVIMVMTVAIVSRTHAVVLAMLSEVTCGW